MYLTKQDLVDLYACSDAVNWFEKTFPDGIELDHNSLATCQYNDWVCWLACKLSKDYRFWCAGVAFREASKIHPALAQYSMNVTPHNWCTANAAAYAAADAADAAYAADADADAADFYKEIREEAERILVTL